MRELKFRAWNKEEKRMFIPIGYFYIDGYLTCIIEDKKTSQNNATEYLDETWYEEGRNPDYSNGKSSVVLMQNTGLTDKNGKEVYEGDVVKFNDECGEWINKVVFERGLFGLGLSPKQIKNPTDWKEKHNKVESRWWSVEWGYEEFGTAFSYRKPLAQRTVYRGNISEYRESDDHKNQEKIGFEKYFIRNCEVIGNIFANPELLEQ